MREVALGYLQAREFDKLIEILKDNKIFNDLLEDHIFNSVFAQNFITELAKIETPVYCAFLYSCHCSPNFSFVLEKSNEEEILKLLIDKTGNYNYAKKLPQYINSIKIINEYQQNLNQQREESIKIAEKLKDFHIVEKYSNNTDNLLKSIFNSPQEKEFYIACTNTFNSYLVLPNIAMSSLFNSIVVKTKYKDLFNFFLKSTIDFVIIETHNFTPILFFELDSKSFHSDLKSKENDEIKNLLITELGKDLIRIMKRSPNKGIEEYIELLTKIKKERNL